MQQPGRKRQVDAETLFDCVAQGAPKRLHRLLSEGGDRSVRDDAERTLIMRACYIDDDTKRESMMKMLLEHGCDINSQDELGRTAMTYAALFGRCDVLKLLFSAGADPLIEDIDGNTPLYHCSSVGNPDVAKLLIETYCGRGFNINKRNLQGMTPLLQAAKLGHVQCAKVLVTEGKASSSLRDLDNFMNAEEWARASGQFTREDLLVLSPVLARKMHCKERRRIEGRKILSDFYAQTERSDGLIRQSANTFRFVSHSDPEVSPGSDEEVDKSVGYALLSASVPNLSLPSLPSTTAFTRCADSQPRSMFQLPRVKASAEFSISTVEEPLSPSPCVKLHKPHPRVHTIQDDGCGRFASSTGFRVQPNKRQGENQTIVPSSVNSCNGLDNKTSVKLPSVPQSLSKKGSGSLNLPPSPSRVKPSHLQHGVGSLSSYNMDSAHSPTSPDKLQQNKSSTGSTGRLGTRPY